MAILSSDLDRGENTSCIFISFSFDMESHIVRDVDSSNARPNPEPCNMSLFNCNCETPICDCVTPSSMSSLLAFELTQAAPQSCCLKDAAFIRM